MKISDRLLRQYVDDLPDTHQLRLLLDLCGIEVKRATPDGDDTVFTVELLANRGDHYCYAGIARELGGRTGAELHTPERAWLDLGECPHPLENQTRLCHVYTGTVLERIGDDLGTLTDDELAPLTAAGIHSLNAPVDASNVANLELGQPTHAFDLDTIEGAVVIRTTDGGEKAWPLFHEAPVELPEGTLVIADDVKILAVAGVIGCEESKTTEKTTRLLLESACFDPVSVRKASRALNIHTDSSARFERGSDPVAPLAGAGRVVYLLEGTGCWQRVGETGQVGLGVDLDQSVDLDVRKANAFLQTDMSADEMAERLRRYGFLVDEAAENRLTVLIPPHRIWDCEANPADLWEELAKSVGYNNTPIGLPLVDMGAVPSPREQRKLRAEEVLLGHGFYEVFTDGFYSRQLRDQLGVTEGHPLYDHVEVENALDRGYSLLKNNCLGQAVEAVANATRMRHLQVKAYEWTRTFHQVDGTGAKRVENVHEQQRLWGITLGNDDVATWAHNERPADIWFLKGVVEELATELGVALTVSPPRQDHPLQQLLHPGRQASLMLGDKQVGIVGEVHPEVVQRFKLSVKKARPCYFEIDADALLSEGRRPAFVEPPAYHPVERALAFTLPRGVRAGDVAAHMQQAGPDHLDAVHITDLYAHEEDGEAVRTVTYLLTFANPNFDLKAEQTTADAEALIASVTKAFGDQGVKLR